MDEQFKKIFAEVVRDQLAQDEEVRLSEIGTFKKEHQNQFQKQHKDGRVMMVPPEDIITFTPEKQTGYG